MPVNPQNPPLYKIAIIGSGPAGIYTAEMLSRHQAVVQAQLQISVDLIEQLPTPYGLIRYGVAPDHPRIKGIVDSLHRILDKKEARFTGSVRFGADLTLDELRDHYDAIVFATGAAKDAALDIPGTELRGFFGASSFVSWYDGHPDAPAEWPLDAEHVAVVGNGNVALDVARMLAKDPHDLSTTEVPAHIQRGLLDSRVKAVHVFGRRGPADAKFTPLELRELGEQAGVKVVVEADELTRSQWPDPATLSTNQARQNLATLEQWRDNPPEIDHSRSVHLYFFHTPISAEGEDTVRSMTFTRTVASPDGHTEGVTEGVPSVTYSVGQVYSAIGYRSAPLPNVPFDAAGGVIENIDGRVSAAGVPVQGLYATGWIKRGPVGLIGHTKSDAKQTVEHLMNDLLVMAPKNSSGDIRSLAQAKDLPWTSWEGWLRLDQEEKRQGEEHRDPSGVSKPRSRTKETSRHVMNHIASGKSDGTSWS